MGRSMSEGVADGLQDMRSRQAESDAFNSRLEANSAAQAARIAERKVEELTAKLYTESGTLYATRSLLASLRKICLENLTEEDLESKRKVWLEGARGWINEHATDAQKLQIRQACTSVSSVRWPDLYDLVPPPKPSVTDPRSFQVGDVTESKLPSLLILTKTRWFFAGEEFKTKKLATDAQQIAVQNQIENFDESIAKYRDEVAALAKWEADFSHCTTF